MYIYISLPGTQIQQLVSLPPAGTLVLEQSADQAGVFVVCGSAVDAGSTIQTDIVRCAVNHFRHLRHPAVSTIAIATAAAIAQATLQRRCSSLLRARVSPPRVSHALHSTVATAA